jgi:hypothetical protein
LGWFCGLVSELELADSEAAQAADSRVWAVVPVTGHSTSPYRHPVHAKQKFGFGALCDGRGRERVAMHCTSLSKQDVTTAQVATSSSSKLALLPPIDHANAFCHEQKYKIFDIQSRASGTIWV